MQFSPTDFEKGTFISSNLEKFKNNDIVDDYLYDNGSFQKIYDLHVVLVNLLKKGIIPMVLAYSI